MLALVFDALSFTDIAIAVGVLGYLVRETLDVLGWSRSSRLLRRENEDLIRRNEELEKEVSRLTEESDRAAHAIDALNHKVDELEKRDQRAVLEALQAHATTLDQILAELRVLNATDGH